MVAAHLQLEGITERGGADECDARSDQKAHFAQAHESGTDFGKFTNDGGRTDVKLGQLHEEEQALNQRRFRDSTMIHIAALWLSASRVPLT